MKRIPPSGGKHCARPSRKPVWHPQKAAISVAAQQHGLVCLDSAGQPLRPAMLWNDTRSASEAIRLREALGGEAVWASRIETWRRVVQRPCGRAVSVPESTELVAVGAAVQAAATLRAETPGETARRWETDHGITLEAEPRDMDAIVQFRGVRQLALEALVVPRSRW